MISSSTILGPDGTPARSSRAKASSGFSEYNWSKVYDAVSRNDLKGFFYFPTLNPTRQLPRLTRKVLRERIGYLYLNVPPVRMVIDGLAKDEVDTGLWPKWTTANPIFNKRATDDFHWTNHDPRFFSADGKNSFYTAQFNIRRCIRLYGDCFGQFLRPAPGRVRPTFNLVPGYRVDNFGDEPLSSGWTDGVLSDRLGFPQKYRVLDDESADGYSDVDEPDMLHFHDPFLPGQTRGEPALASCARRLFSREDILAALVNGTIARERQGFYIQHKGSGVGNLEALPSGGEVSTVTNPDGTSYTVQKIFGADAQDQVDIPELNDGSELKMLESDRPAPPVREFLDEILREVGWSTCYPPEYIYFLAGLGNGTAVRLIMQKVQGSINSAREFQLNEFVHRWAVYDTWQKIVAGAFDGIEGGIPADWWKHEIKTPAPKSVDVGREGRLYNERVACGLMSIGAFHALAGEDASDVEDELIERVEARLKKLAKLNKDNGTQLDYFSLWPRSTSMQITAPSDVPENQNPPAK